jgi:hypothetical protein
MLQTDEKRERREDVPLSGNSSIVADILVHHLANRIAQSRPASECLTLQKNAWLFATRSTPSLTGMPSM